MSTHRLSLTVFSLLVVLVASCQTPAPLNELDSIPGISRTQLDLIYEHGKTFPPETQMALAFVEGDEVVFYGVKCMGEEMVRVENRDSLFEIGSITKTFTTTLLAQSVVDGTVDLDDPVDQHLGFALNKDYRISLEQFANHSSGFPRISFDLAQQVFMRPENPYEFYEEEDLINYLKRRIALSREPGEAYEYSNQGIGTLTLALERANEMSFDQMLREWIFEPYGMANTYSTWRQAESGIVSGRDKAGRPIQNWDLGAISGAGSIMSCTADMVRYAQAQFDTTNEVIQLAHTPTFEVKDNLSVALGWHISTRDSGLKVHWHNGGTGGYSTILTLDMERQRAVVLLTNLSTFHEDRPEVDYLGFDLLENWAE